MRDIKDFFKAVEALRIEKNVSSDAIYGKIANAFVKAAGHNFGTKEGIFCDILPEEELVRLYMVKTVVETDDDVMDPAIEISQDEAQKYRTGALAGECVEIDLEIDDFGRIAAQTVKHVLRQGIRDIEHEKVLADLQSKNQETVSARIRKVDPKTGNLTLEIGSTEALLPKTMEEGGIENYEVLAKMPSLILLNLANNAQWSAAEALKGIKELAQGAAAEKIQMLYFNSNNLEVIPKEIKKMKKLGLLDFSSNKIHTIEEAWGNDIKPVQIYFDNNKLSEFPVDEHGVFCYMEDAETFSVKMNNFTEFPNIFDAESLFAIVSIDFSYNHISSFPEDFRGVFVQTLTIANNPELTKYPIELAKSNSKIMNINFRGCNINEIPEGSFDYENAIQLSSFDFSYNDLKELPWEMHAGNMPYLYGVELSYNQFSKFPWGPLDSQYLTVFAIRGQRDENGERCLSEWPTGIYQHRGLRGFYIGSNNLGKIEDTISTICYYLDISDNPEIIFDASDVCYAIQQGAYVLIYDKTQDIRNCDILF